MDKQLYFYELVGALKILPRTGWVDRGIPNPETVAEHMYRSQFIAYDLAKTLGYSDPQSCSHMMMLHNLPEALAGDITPHSDISKDEKKRLESEAAKTLAELSGNSEFYDMFIEYEEKQTLRSRICGDADQLECLIQNLEYLKQYPEKQESLQAFWPYAEAKITTSAGKDMFQRLVRNKHLIERQIKQGRKHYPSPT